MERSSEIANNLNKTVKINVEKNNGIKERFRYEKRIKIYRKGKRLMVWAIKNIN